VEDLERRLHRFQLLCLILMLICASTLVAACSRLYAGQSEAAAGIVRARGIVIVDEQGRERIHIGSPVPDPPGEPGHRIAAATGMIILDENGRERWGLGHRTDDWTVMGFDAAPGNGTGANRERLHIGVDNEGRGFLRYLDRSSGIAGRLHLTEEDQLALEFWKGNARERRFRRGNVDVDGWHPLPDFVLPPAR
jgi:hypothetical protein